MEQLKELLNKDGTETINFLTDSLAKAFTDISDGAVEAEFQRDFNEVEIFMIVKKRGQK